MSKFIKPELLNHYQQLKTTIARCLKIERRDGKMIALTEHDHDLMIEGIHYQSAIGYVPTAISMQDKGAVNTVDVEGILSVAGISREDIAAGLFDQARIFVFEVNYNEVSQGILPLTSGFWGECQLYDNHYVTEFKSLSHVLQQTVGELYSTHCRAQLGDMRCGVQLATFTAEGVVANINPDLPARFTAAGFDQLDQYFQYGLITWQKGKNTGLSMEIKAFQSISTERTQEVKSSIFQLVQSMPYPIKVGDIFFVTPGCDKSFAMCKNKFHNIVNFRGEPFIPGIDRMLKTP